MDSDQAKLFIGGISWETTEDKLKDYFQGYGDVVKTVVMRDKLTGRPRGFGFVVFADPDILDRVLVDTHVIDGRTVEAKRAMSREEQQVTKVGSTNPARNFEGDGNNRTKKIFVGGLPPTLTENEFRQYFEAYGDVTDVVIMYDQQTNRPRGFGFISFDSEDAVDRVLHKSFHDLSGKQVEVKRAMPRDTNPGASGRSMGGRGGFGGYVGSGNNPNSYDGRTESSRYMQSQNTGSGYPPYSSSGYNTPGYGYGPANNGMGYGGYGSFGGSNPGYGGSAGGAYANPNIPNFGYGSGPTVPGRGSWGTPGQSGYGNMGYGNASWGASSAAAAAGPGAQTGQSPTGAGYGNQSYGYGGYAGNPAAYGAVGRGGAGPNNGVPGAGGEQQAGGAYGDGNSPYGNQGWRSDPSQASGYYGGHGGSATYGGGYGGASTHQAQQQ